MKKIKLDAEKLQLNKEKITEMTVSESVQIQGGFTYSLSWGAFCKESKGLGAGDPYTCGLKVGSIAANICQVTPK